MFTGRARYNEEIRSIRDCPVAFDIRSSLHAPRSFISESSIEADQSEGKSIVVWTTRHRSITSSIAESATQRASQRAAQHHDHNELQQKSSKSTTLARKK